MKPTIAIFGSSLTSAYWNGAATYYRGMLRALAQRGYSVTFYEPDAHDRLRHRDIPTPPWAKVEVYSGDEVGVSAALDQARVADVIIKASGVGVFDEWLDASILALKALHSTAVYWDVDAPATLDRLKENPDDPFRPLIREFDFVLTYGGGDSVVRGYLAQGARQCVPIYSALDPLMHYPVPPERRYSSTLSFLGNRLPDREQRVEEFLFDAAHRLPQARMLLGGSGWEDKLLPANIHGLGHVYTADHNAFNSTALAVLNISRDSSARHGHSPATRLFEAAGAGACIVTDAFEGIECFLEPGSEVLVATSGEEVAEAVSALDRTIATRIGESARRRIVAHHTYDQRAAQLDGLLEGQAVAQ